jgi:hypothetical protein
MRAGQGLEAADGLTQHEDVFSSRASSTQDAWRYSVRCSRLIASEVDLIQTATHRGPPQLLAELRERG